MLIEFEQINKPQFDKAIRTFNSRSKNKITDYEIGTQNKIFNILHDIQNGSPEKIMSDILNIKMYVERIIITDYEDVLKNSLNEDNSYIEYHEREIKNKDGLLEKFLVYGYFSKYNLTKDELIELFNKKFNTEFSSEDMKDIGKRSEICIDRVNRLLKHGLKITKVKHNRWQDKEYNRMNRKNTNAKLREIREFYNSIGETDDLLVDDLVKYKEEQEIYLW